MLILPPSTSGGFRMLTHPTGSIGDVVLKQGSGLVRLLPCIECDKWFSNYLLSFFCCRCWTNNSSLLWNKIMELRLLRRGGDSIPTLERFVCSENISDSGTGTNSLGMLCLTTGGKRLPVNIDSTFMDCCFCVSSAECSAPLL